MNKLNLYLMLCFLSLITAISSCTDSKATETDTEAVDVKVQTIQVGEKDAEEVLASVIEASHRQQLLGDLSYELNYLPSAYFIQKNNARSDSLQAHAYEAQSVFLFKIRAAKYHDELLKYQIQSVNEYYHRIEYFSFKFNNDVQLVLNKNDTFNCTNHHFERNYGLAPEIKILLNFQLPEEQLFQAKSVQLIYTDRVFGNGKVKFQFEPNHFKRIHFSQQD